MKSQPSFHPTLRVCTLLYCCLLLIFLFTTYFIPFPTDAGYVGLSSDALDIGDRPFYIDSSSLKLSHIFSFGNRLLKPSPLYPFILSLFTSVASLFGQSTASRLWNLLAISSSAICLILAMRLLYLSSLQAVNLQTARFSVILFAISPYTYFYTISGGITSYMILGAAMMMYSISALSDNSINSSLRLKGGLSFMASSVYLSLLRPSGCIFVISMSFLSLLWFCNILPSSFKYSRLRFYIPVFFFAATFALIQVYNSLTYIDISLNMFSNEPGTFLGFPRQDLRNILLYCTSCNNIPNIILLSFWKLMDFLIGISDLRDSFLGEKHSSVLPFIFRVASGLFYLAPFNLALCLSVLLYRRSLLLNPLIIPAISAIIAVSPSLIGVAMSRYYVMVYIVFFPMISSLIAFLAPHCSAVRFPEFSSKQ